MAGISRSKFFCSRVDIEKKPLTIRGSHFIARIPPKQVKLYSPKYNLNTSVASHHGDFGFGKTSLNLSDGSIDFLSSRLLSKFRKLLPAIRAPGGTVDISVDDGPYRTLSMYAQKSVLDRIGITAVKAFGNASVALIYRRLLSELGIKNVTPDGGIVELRTLLFGRLIELEERSPVAVMLDNPDALFAGDGEFLKTYKLLAERGKRISLLLFCALEEAYDLTFRFRTADMAQPEYSVGMNEPIKREEIEQYVSGRWKLPEGVNRENFLDCLELISGGWSRNVEHLVFMIESSPSLVSIAQTTSMLIFFDLFRDEILFGNFFNDKRFFEKQAKEIKAIGIHGVKFGDVLQIVFQHGNEGITSEVLADIMGIDREMAVFILNYLKKLGILKCYQESERFVIANIYFYAEFFKTTDPIYNNNTEIDFRTAVRKRIVEARFGQRLLKAEGLSPVDVRNPADKSPYEFLKNYDLGRRNYLLLRTIKGILKDPISSVWHKILGSRRGGKTEFTRNLKMAFEGSNVIHIGIIDLQGAYEKKHLYSSLLSSIGVSSDGKVPGGRQITKRNFLDRLEQLMNEKHVLLVFDETEGMNIKNPTLLPELFEELYKRRLRGKGLSVVVMSFLEESSGDFENRASGKYDFEYKALPVLDKNEIEFMIGSRLFKNPNVIFGDGFLDFVKVSTAGSPYLVTQVIYELYRAFQDYGFEALRTVVSAEGDLSSFIERFKDNWIITSMLSRLNYDHILDPVIDYAERKGLMDYVNTLIVPGEISMRPFSDDVGYRFIKDISYIGVLLYSHGGTVYLTFPIYHYFINSSENPYLGESILVSLARYAKKIKELGEYFSIE